MNVGNPWLYVLLGRTTGTKPGPVEMSVFNTLGLGLVHNCTYVMGLVYSFL
jgi:hypothetical protein